MAERRPRVLRPNRRLGLGRGANGQRQPPAPEVSMESRPVAAAAPVEQTVVAAAIYRDGRRVDSPTTVADAARRLRDQGDTMAWIGLYRPSTARSRRRSTKNVTGDDRAGEHEGPPGTDQRDEDRGRERAEPLALPHVDGLEHPEAPGELLIGDQALEHRPPRET